MLAQEKASSFGVGKRGGANIKLCIEKNNNVTLQVQYGSLNLYLKCNFTV